MSVKSAIKTILEAAGSVRMSYKLRYDDWITECILASLMPDQHHSHIRYICWTGGLDIDTQDIDEAVEKYCNHVFTKKNLALVYSGIRKHRLTQQEFDVLSKEELHRLVRIYRNKYFSQDYPEFSDAKGDV